MNPLRYSKPLENSEDMNTNDNSSVNFSTQTALKSMKDCKSSHTLHKYEYKDLT